MYNFQVFLLTAFAVLLFSSVSNAQIEDYQQPPISQLLDQVEVLHIDLIVKIERSMSEEEIQRRIQTLTLYDEDIKIGYERNEEGRITKLMCTHPGRMCGSDDFGHLLVTMKEGKFYNCRVVDRK